MKDQNYAATTKTAEIRLAKRSPEYWRVTFDHPPLNIFGPEMLPQVNEIITAIETDEQVKVVVFDSAVEGFFLIHLDFLARLDDLAHLPPGPTGLHPWPEMLVRLSRAPVVSIASIRGRATGMGFVVALANRIVTFDKQTIVDTKRLVNVASLPPDIEIESGWNACVASMARPATQQRIKTLIERGFCKPGDAENRLGDFVGR